MKVGDLVRRVGYDESRVWLGIIVAVLAGSGETPQVEVLFTTDGYRCWYSPRWLEVISEGR